MPPLNLYARVRFLDAQFAHETAGAARTRSSLRLFLEVACASSSFGAEFICKPRAHRVARMRSYVRDRSPDEPTGRANARPMTGSTISGAKSPAYRCVHAGYRIGRLNRKRSYFPLPSRERVARIVRCETGEGSRRRCLWRRLIRHGLRPRHLLPQGEKEERRYPPLLRSGTRVILAPSALRRSSMRS